ncbi:kinase-like protein [Canariomyces notabilis]|uniref:EKC/KEOPS complex subunit BUD32 n=1 Tax=Canariomyces notabilis TaxID=2074819 RepID=A0AAN6TFU4_9PEZI|nr:kinase-like protein [Canariomyces arenarius]
MATSSSPSETPTQSQQFPLPKVLTYPASAPPTLITQGAEGRLYKTTHLTPDRPCALKYRPPKAYRHPILDARLTKARLSSEAKVLERCWREGVPVPAVYAMDPAAGWMMLEWIEGVPVRMAINEWLGERPEEEEEEEDQGQQDKDIPPGAGEAAAGEEEAPLVNLMRRIGTVVGALHRTGVVHGDLTTSNMMLRPWGEKGQPNGCAASEEDQDKQKGKVLEGDVVLIDFGLATQSMSDEDRAVDLYVLERAFASTHPRAERLFTTVLDSYREAFKKAPSVLAKLEDVRMRGRKRSMLG